MIDHPQVPLRRLLRLLLVLVAAVMIQPASAQEAAPAESADGMATAIFAGGCFWCMEEPFDVLPGVTDTTSGYIGGTVDNPEYRQVTAGGTGHLEAVRVTYDPAQVGYDQLLEVFWRNIDPTDDGGQFCDRGDSYRTAIFATTPEQRAAAEASKAALEASGRLQDPIVTPVRDADTFWPAEAYHQNFYQTNEARYKYYRSGCGRDLRLRQLWGSS